MKKFIAFILVIFCFSTLGFAVTLKPMSEGVLGLQWLKSYESDTVDKEAVSLKAFTQYFDQYKCPTSLYVAQNIINVLDPYIYASKDTSKTRQMVYDTLKKYSANNQKTMKTIDPKVRNYILGYYDADLSNDYTNGCLGTPHQDQMRPYITAGRILLQGYVQREEREFFPNCQYGIGDCEKGFTVPFYSFVLTKDIVQKNLPQYLLTSGMKVGSKIPFGCVFDGRLAALQYDALVSKNTYRSKVFVMSQNVTDSLLSSSKNKPISVYGGYSFLVSSSDQGHRGLVCGGEFRTLDMTK